MARRSVAAPDADRQTKPDKYQTHPLVGRRVRSYGATDLSLIGPKGTIEAVFATADSSVGNLAMLRLDNGGCVLLPLSRLAVLDSQWQWIVEIKRDAGC